MWDLGFWDWALLLLPYAFVGGALLIGAVFLGAWLF